jgi:Helix-turn-helix domain
MASSAAWATGTPPRGYRTVVVLRCSGVVCQLSVSAVVHILRHGLYLAIWFSIPAILDRAFVALADAHRREILDRLGAGPVSISDLAAPLGMSPPDVVKHVRALEEAREVFSSAWAPGQWVDRHEEQRPDQLEDGHDPEQL